MVPKPYSSAPSMRSDGQIAPRAELPVGLNDDPAAQPVEQQGLMRFRQSQLPGQPGMLDAALRRCAGSAIIATDEDDIGMALGNTGGDSPNPYFGHQLDVDTSIGIGVFQIMDQLRQVFDRVDVMVRRRRNQADARSGDSALRQSRDTLCVQATARLPLAWPPAPS